MTELRDARLKRALQSAPDASETPARATRDAIRAAAQSAVRKPAATPWWRWSRSEPRHRMPWNAAFATVLLAVLVGTLWHDKEVPDARPQAQVANPPPPGAVPAPPPEAAPAVSAPLARRRPEVAKPQPAQPKAAPMQPAPADVPATPPPAPAVAGELAKQQSADAVAESRAFAPAPSVAPAAAPPAPAARLRAEQAPLRDVAAPSAWTDMRIVSGPRTLLVPRSQAPELATAIERLLASDRRADAPSSPADMRVELLREGKPVTVLELAPGRFGDDGSLQKARDEIARLFAR